MRISQIFMAQCYCLAIHFFENRSALWIWRSLRRFGSKCSVFCDIHLGEFEFEQFWKSAAILMGQSYCFAIEIFENRSALWIWKSLIRFGSHSFSSSLPLSLIPSSRLHFLFFFFDVFVSVPGSVSVSVPASPSFFWFGGRRKTKHGALFGP